MRSVIVHLIETSIDRVGDTLSEFAVHNTPDQWLYPEASNPSLYIEMFPQLTGLNYSEEEIAGLEKVLGRKPEVSVVADVSGRVPGDAEVSALIELLLTHFRGVANDEFSPHYWTLEEIRSNASFHNHRFFDYGRVVPRHTRIDEA